MKKPWMIASPFGQGHGSEGDVGRIRVIDVFFSETWGYVQTGQGGSEVDINDNTLIS